MSGKEKSKVWFITGISRGFGRELALAAPEQGDVVIGTTRNGKSDIPVAPDRFHVFALDVTNRQEVVSVVTQAWQICGRIDVVANNAGFGVLGAVEEVKEKLTRKVFETNFFGLLSVTQAALPHLRSLKILAVAMPATATKELRPIISHQRHTAGLCFKCNRLSNRPWSSPELFLLDLLDGKTSAKRTTWNPKKMRSLTSPKTG
jgi:NAD(P)-dependent dehydrogenase (short-subunit alcohol dehydrogenase family)